MSLIEVRVRAAQRRLWLARWLRGLVLALCWSGVGLATAIVVIRLFDASVSIAVLVLGGVALAAVISVGWMIATRESANHAAVALDAAAGLHERLSSGRYCDGAADPFAQAVLADANRAAASLSVRRHLRLAMPPALPAAGGSAVLCLLALLTPRGLWVSDETRDAREWEIEQSLAQVAVKRQLESVKRMAEENPALQELKDKLDDLDAEAGGELRRPGEIRHEAVKRIDALADAVKEKRRNASYDSLQDLRKRLRGLKSPSSAEAPTQKLAEAMQRGDFQGAKEEVQQIREQLATLKLEQDQELVEQLSRKLEELSKQLEQLSKTSKLPDELKNANLAPEDVERLLEHLKKQDLQQVEKELAQRGMRPEQIEELVKKLEQSQESSELARKLAEALGKAGQSAASGQVGDADAGLAMAEGQLSELEALEVEMSQLEGALADLQQAREGLDKPCPT